MGHGKTETSRNSLYSEVTARVIAELEQGRRLPRVQPWDTAACDCSMPHYAGTGRRYSGINVLILLSAVRLWGAGVAHLPAGAGARRQRPARREGNHRLLC